MCVKGVGGRKEGGERERGAGRQGFSEQVCAESKAPDRWLFYLAREKRRREKRERECPVQSHFYCSSRGYLHLDSVRNCSTLLLPPPPAS